MEERNKIRGPSLGLAIIIFICLLSVLDWSQVLAGNA